MTRHTTRMMVCLWLGACTQDAPKQAPTPQGDTDPASLLDSDAGPRDDIPDDDTPDDDTPDDDPAPLGFAAFCERYLECGGVFYETAEACIEATFDYFGDCPAVRQVLDVYGTCMLSVPCDTYDPDAYDPADTPCADAWFQLLDTDC